MERLTRFVITAGRTLNPDEKYVVGSIMAFPPFGDPPPVQGTAPEIEELIDSLFQAWIGDPGYDPAAPDTDFIDILRANGLVDDVALITQVEYHMDRSGSESESP